MGQDYKNLENRIIKKAWEDETFKKELLENPRAAIQRELEIVIPEDIEIKVVEETPKTVYLVLPVNPELTSVQDGMEDSGLEPTGMTYI